MKIEDISQLMFSIDEIIEWYSNNSSVAPVNMLIDAQDKLSSYSWTLAELCGNTKENYTVKYLIRKIEVNKKAQTLIKEKAVNAMNQALSRAEIENEDILKEEIAAEAAAYTADLKLKQVNKILQVMQQRISYTKKLWELNIFQDGKD